MEKVPSCYDREFGEEAGERNIDWRQFSLVTGSGYELFLQQNRGKV